MTFDPLAAAPPAVLIHLAVASLALVVAPVQFLLPKGSFGHRWRGRFWVGFMAIVAVGSFWIRHPDGSLTWIHALSAITLLSLVCAIRSIRRGDVRSHKQWMTGASIGLAIAFAFTFVPGRLVAQLFGL